MAVVVVCSLLLLGGVGAVLRWGSRDVTLPGPRLEPRSSGADAARRYIWWTGLVFYTTVATAVLVVGPAARLAMRILAVTAGADAQGRKTEADEIVGRITAGGTIGIFVFVGLFFALLSALGYVAARRFVPSGRGGGLLMGALFLAIGATRIDPLRSNNPDFDLVGPGWLAVAIFCAMALLQGMALVALSARISHVLPEPRGVAILAYVPMVIVIPTIVAPAALLAGLAITVAGAQSERLYAALRSRRFTIAGRVAIAAAVAVSLPGAVRSIASIAGRP